MTDPILLSLERLRQDAVEQGMVDLAICYSWSIVARRGQMIARALEAFNTLGRN